MLLLLVDDYRAEVVHGREDRRASSDYYVGTPVLYLTIGLVSLCRGKPRMHNGNTRAVASAEYRKGLRGESNLGQKHDNSATLLSHFINKLKHYRGLSASRDTLEQHSMCLARIRKLTQLTISRVLLGTQHNLTRVDRYVIVLVRAEHHSLLAPHKSLFDKSAYLHRRRTAGTS